MAAGGFDHGTATRQIVRAANDLLDGSPVVAVDHRAVHGGRNYAAPVRIGSDVIDELERLVPLAPLHQPHNLAPIRAIISVSQSQLSDHALLSLTS